MGVRILVIKVTAEVKLRRSASNTSEGWHEEEWFAQCFGHPIRIGTGDRGMDLGLHSQEKSSQGAFPAAAVETLVLDVVGHVKCAGLKSLCIDSSSADAGASGKWSRPLQGTI